MKSAVIVSIFLMLSIHFMAQYKLANTVNGVEFYSKWGHEKWWSKKSDRVLLVKVKNTNSLAVRFQLGVELVKDLRVIESSPAAEYCLDQYATANPRRRGLVFKATASGSEAHPNQFELTDLKVEKLLAMECHEVDIDKK